MSAVFLLQLLALAGLVYILFYAYGKIAGRYSAGLLGGLSGGFVAFLAFNELIALPFMLLHLPFLPFYILFLIINIPLFIFGCLLLIRKLPTYKSELIKPSVFAAVAILTVIACTLITQFYVKYDADDSFYVSLIQQNIGSDSLYTTDPSTGNSTLPTSQTYSFEGWELLESALANTLRLPPVEFAHSLIPILIIPLVFLAHRKIFRELLAKEDSVNYATIVLGLFFIFSGFSLYSQGTFLLTRVWQGKAILAALIIPLLLFTLYKLYNEKQHRKKLYLALLLLNIAAICLSPSAIFINFAAMAVFGGVILYKNRAIHDFLYLVFSSLPILLAGIGAIILTKLNPSTVKPSTTEQIGTTGWLEYASRFVGDSWYLYLYLFGIALIFFSKKKRETLLLFAVFPLLLLATFLNPLLIEPIKGYITSNPYWRFLWLIPVTIALPYMAARSASLLSARFRTPFLIIGMLLIVLVVASGSFMFNTSKPLVAYDPSRTKVPAGVEQVAEFMKSVPDGKVLSATDPAAYLHNFTTKHTLLVSRELYLGVYYEEESPEYIELSKLKSAIDGVEAAYNPMDFSQLAEDYGVKYLIFHAQNQLMDQFVQLNNYKILFSSEHYEVAQIR